MRKVLKKSAQNVSKRWFKTMAMVPANPFKASLFFQLLKFSYKSRAQKPHEQRTRTGVRDFLCGEYLNVYHRYLNMTISKSFNYRFGMKTKNIFDHKNRQKETKMDGRTHICFWRHVCKDREHKKHMRNKK